MLPRSTALTAAACMGILSGLQLHCRSDFWLPPHAGAGGGIDGAGGGVNGGAPATENCLRPERNILRLCERKILSLGSVDSAAMPASHGRQASGPCAHPVRTSCFHAGSLNLTVACTVCRPGLRLTLAGSIFADVTCFRSTAPAWSGEVSIECICARQCGASAVHCCSGTPASVARRQTPAAPAPMRHTAFLRERQCKR